MAEDAKSKAEKDAAASLTKEERRKAAKLKKRTMESCLTLVRATYTAQNDMIEDFVKAHPTEDKSRLISKILAQMMMLCNGAISVEQIEYLQEFKMNPGELDHSKPEFKKLVDINFEALKFVPTDEENPIPGLAE